MDKIIEFIQKKKYEMIVIIVLLIILFAVIPMAVGHAVDSAIGKHMQPINDYIVEMDHKINDISDRQIADITERGIAAYNKVYTIQDLKDNAQNAISIKIALSTPKVRDILFSIDKDRTLLFEKYFRGTM